MSDPPSHTSSSTSNKAVMALIFGFGAFCAGILGIPAVILGAVAKSEIERSGGTLDGKGMAIWGMALGSLGLLLNCIGFLAIIASKN